jgi:hypothetical protein
MLIFSCFEISSTHSSVLKNQFPSFLHSVRLWLWFGWPEPSASVTLVRPFLNISIHLYTTLRERESIVTILNTHALMNLFTWCTFCPQKIYHRSLLLFGAILKFRCHVHRFVATLTLTTRSTGLPCRLVT